VGVREDPVREDSELREGVDLRAESGLAGSGLAGSGLAGSGLAESGLAIDGRVGSGREDAGVRNRGLTFRATTTGTLREALGGESADGDGIVVGSGGGIDGSAAIAAVSVSLILGKFARITELAHSCQNYQV